MGKKIEMLIAAGNQFFHYATQHYAKTPPQLEKGDVNVDFGRRCFKAAGAKHGGVPVRPDFRPVESDSAVEAGEDTLETPELPVTVAEVTGNIAESELLGRYLAAKAVACRNHIANRPHRAEGLEHTIRVLETTAEEVRDGLHIPPVIIEGKVIPYNEDRDSGQRHADSLRLFFTDVYGRNLKAGWWTNIEDGTPKKRNVGELFILFITEIAEAYMAYRDNLPDDKLPEYPGLGVELADLGIRWADFCGALLAGNIVEHSGARNPGDEMFIEILEIAQRYEAIRKTPEAVGEPEAGVMIPAADVATMVDAKLDFNAHREDHKIENRLKEDGKRT